MRALAIVNPRAGGGRAVRRYAAVRARIERDLDLDLDEVFLDSADSCAVAIHRAERGDVERIIAVGGDGTVSAVANALLARGTRISLGAIGLGSSNDFHKPACRRVEGVSVKLDVPVKRDVGHASWTDDRGRKFSRWFVVSASIGLVARANRRFGSSPTIARVSTLSVEAAIIAAAARALVDHEDVRARVGGERRTFANLSIMLTPFLAGGFRHRGGAAAGGGAFAVHESACSSRADLLTTIARLRISASTPKVKSWSASSIEVDIEREVDLELDGEVFRARRVKFHVAPDMLEVCS